MADLVGLNVQSPDMMAKLGQLMQLKSQQTALQGAQQTQRQRAGIASYNFEQHLADDGTPDVESLAADPALRQIAGDQFFEVLNHANTVKQQQLNNIKTLTSVRKDQREAFAEMMGALRGDSDVAEDNDKGRQKITQGLIQFGETHGPSSLPILKAYSSQLQSTPKGKLDLALRAIQMQAMSADQQAEMQRSKPQFMQSKKGIQGIETNQYAPGAGIGSAVGQPVEQGIAPQTLMGPSGQLLTTTPSGALKPMEGTQPGLNPTAVEQATQAGLARGVTDRVTQATATANNTVQAQDALSRAKAILESPEAPNTGMAFERKKGLKNLMSSLGIDTKGADDDNSLVKNLARYEAARATSAGLGGTDAARELAHNGSPNTQIDKKALIGIVNQSLATEKALAAYANKQSKTKDPGQLQANETAFRSIPNMIEGYEYGMSRSKEEANEFLKRHGISAEDMKKTRTMIKAFENGGL
jgi:hypothetical protein